MRNVLNRFCINLSTAKLAALIWVAAIAALGVALLTSPAQSAPLSSKVAAELLSASVVRMTTGGSPLCSASKIGPATFLTAAHCARALKGNYRVEHGSHYQFIKSITITVSEKADGKRSEDWAILHATTENSALTPLSLACDEPIYLGMPIAYAGFPDPVNFAFGMGYVASVNPLENRVNDADFAIDVQAGPGASGSPIISLDSGRVIGVLTEGVFRPKRTPFLVGVESIRSLDLCDGKTNPQPTADTPATPF